jgi:hypothetical protein
MIAKGTTLGYCFLSWNILVISFDCKLNQLNQGALVR